jgi:hypothetical protein
MAIFVTVVSPIVFHWLVKLFGTFPRDSEVVGSFPGSIHSHDSDKSEIKLKMALWIATSLFGHSEIVGGSYLIRPANCNSINLQPSGTAGMR